MTRGMRLLSALLALVMCFSLLPVTVLAEEEATAEPTAEQLNIDAAEPGETETPEPPAETGEDPDAVEPAEEESAEEELPAEDGKSDTSTAAEPLPTAEPAGAEPAEEEPTVIEEDIALLEETVAIDPADWPDNDEMFAGYVDEIMGLSQRVSLYTVINVGDRLTGLNKTVYDAMRGYISQVAAGQRAYTAFELSLEELGLADVTWTAAELGVESIVEKTSAGTTVISSAATAAAREKKIPFDLQTLLSALLSDCPYELYWFDKTNAGGMGATRVSLRAERNKQTGEYVLRPSSGMTVSMYVAKEYSVTGRTKTLMADTSVGASIAAARKNAAAIVSRYMGASDYSKLVAYRKEICALVSYNRDALGDDVSYGNPWQLIWVFDGDETTNVVCEGYAKAFRYLCDMTDFSGDVCCYTVTGYMNGGKHMWNIVSMPDGKNYLVDVTNCDAGMAGYPDRLFLAGAYSGSADSSYTYRCGQSITYVYDDNLRKIYTAEELTMSMTAYALSGAEAGGEDGLSYRLANGTASVTGYTGDQTAVEIPAAVTVDGTEYPVTAIGDYAFHSNAGLVSVTMPEGIVSIGFGAFYDCAALQSAAIPASVIYLGGYAFAGCKALTEVTLPAGLAAMGEAAFDRCNGLKTLTISEGVAAIGDYAFSHCNQLTRVVIPNTVVTVGSYAFARCVAMADLTISGSVTSIGDCAFFECVSLTAVSIPEGVAAMGDYVFYNCYDLKTVSLPSTLESLGEFAFAKCAALTAAVIPGGVKTVGDCAFSDCTALSELTVGEGVTDIGFGAFYNSGLIAVVIPATVKTIQTGAFAKCAALAQVTIAAQEIEIAANAFYGTPWRKAMGDFFVVNGVLIDYRGTTPAVTVPEGVTAIGNYAFQGCESMTAITVPASVTDIGESAFDSCTALESVTVEGTVETIGRSAFTGTPWLAAQGDFAAVCGILIAYQGEDAVVTLPETVKRVNGYAFYGSTAAEAILLPESVERIDDRAFYGCGNLSLLTFFGDIPSLADNAFYGVDAEVYYCADSGSFTAGTMLNYGGEAAWRTLSGSCGEQAGWELMLGGRLVISGSGAMGHWENQADVPWYTWQSGIREAEIGAGVTTVGGYAFTGCAGLRTVTIPAGVKGIGTHAFWDCTGLTEVTVPEGLETIGGFAFQGCEKLTEIVMPDSVTSIGNSAFRACTGLKTVKLSAGLTAIEEYAFCDCAGLTGITFPEGLEAIGGYAFYGCRGLTELLLPESAAAVGNSAFRECTGLQSVRLRGAETIGYAAFYQCEKLTALELPDSTAVLENLAFGRCAALKSVTFRGDAPDMAGKSFYNVTAAAYYYEDNEGWLSAKQNYGGTLSWQSMGSRYFSLVSEDRKITVSREETDWDSGMTVTLRPAALEDAPRFPEGTTVRKYTAYDISLTGGELTGSVKVRLKAPLGYGRNCRVYRMEADGALTDMNARYVDEVLVFTTDHLSLYVVAQELLDTLKTGDANADSRVDIFDAMTIARTVVGLVAPEPDEEEASDVTGEGNVSLLDAVYVAHYSVGAISTFPKDAAGG